MALEINGFTDWYIPSRHEQALQYFSLLNAEGYQAGQPNAFTRRGHWSSTQYSPYYAWIQGFDVGVQRHALKGSEFRARAVRRFKVTP
ncbi:hypothetical protein D9M70_464570 [compost metagenome]